MSVLPYYVEGLSSLASKTGRNIPETALLAIAKIIKQHPEHPYLSTDIKDIVDSADTLNPGDIYVFGLQGLAEMNRGLRQAATKSQVVLQNIHSEEHIPPLWQAFNWLTGEKP